MMDNSTISARMSYRLRLITWFKKYNMLILSLKTEIKPSMLWRSNGEILSKKTKLWIEGYKSYQMLIEKSDNMIARLPCWAKKYRDWTIFSRVRSNNSIFFKTRIGPMRLR